MSVLSSIYGTESQPSSRCIQKPFTKAVLLAATFFCASGAKKAYFRDFSMPYVVSFSAAGALTLSAFIFSCVQSCRSKEEHESKHSDEGIILSELKAMTDEELVSALQDSPSIDDIPNPEQESVLQELANRLEKLFNDNATRGSDAVILAFTPLFERLLDDPVKFCLLASHYPHRNLRYTPSFYLSILAGLPWPNDEIKMRFAENIADKFLAWVNSFAVIQGIFRIDQKNYPINEVHIESHHIFGEGNVQEPLSDLTVHVLAKFYEMLGEMFLKDLKREKTPTKLGMKILIGAMHCRFHASLIVPIIETMNVPGLVSFIATSLDEGFRNEHADALLEFVDRHPHLIEFKIRNNMEGEVKEAFEARLKDILSQREIPTVESLTSAATIKSARKR